MVAGDGARATDPRVDPRGRLRCGIDPRGGSGARGARDRHPRGARRRDRGGIPRIGSARRVRRLRGGPAARRRLPRGGAQPRRRGPDVRDRGRAVTGPRTAARAAAPFASERRAAPRPVPLRRAIAARAGRPEPVAAPGEWLGLTGPSGAGKTTIVGLLLRFVDAGSGSVLLDGVDVRRFRGEDVRARIGVVPQQVYLFNGTLRDNLLVADGDADDTRIARACDRAGLGGFLRSLPQRARHARRGRRSEAERRRNANGWRSPASFLKDAPILILDEATANLDAGTEARSSTNSGTFARGKSVLVISHRPRRARARGSA